LSVDRRLGCVSMGCAGSGSGSSSTSDGGSRAEGRDRSGPRDGCGPSCGIGRCHVDELMKGSLECQLRIGGWLAPGLTSAPLIGTVPAVESE
jgi:hypothetical protein